MVRLLIAAGCAGAGETKDYQPWDEQVPQGDLIVFRRHLPQAVDRPPWSGPNVITSLERHGYTVHVLIMTRDWHCTTASHAKEGYTADPEFSRQWLQTLWRQLFEQLPKGVAFEVVPYEALVQRPDAAIPALMARLGLNSEADFEYIIDGNEKYYAKETAVKKVKRGKRSGL
jgi:hypothetical protein